MVNLALLPNFVELKGDQFAVCESQYFGQAVADARYSHCS